LILHGGRDGNVWAELGDQGVPVGNSCDSRIWLAILWISNVQNPSESA
jgi:hypothetical protein